MPLWQEGGANETPRIVGNLRAASTQHDTILGNFVAAHVLQKHEELSGTGEVNIHTFVILPFDFHKVLSM